MFSDRIAVSIFLIPLALFVVVSGGLIYLLGILLIYTLAALEYVQLFRHGGYRPALPLVVGGVLAVVVAQQVPALNPRGLVFGLIILAALAWHQIDYERGAATSGADFVVTLGGIFYLGWLGTYFIALRNLPPDGLWWLVAAVTAVWLADTGAYSIGRRFGRHAMAPRLSPKKTWEGFAGGVLGGALGAGVLSVFWHIGAAYANPQTALTWQSGALLGALIGVLSPLGDLGVSMFKRQIGVKDSGDLIAGHGGALDRMDSWLIAVPVGYYFALVLQAMR
jgi:phosphatidate cytidylyltransferase